MSSIPTPPVHALVRFGLNSPNALRLVEFYERAFGAEVTSRERRNGRGCGRSVQGEGGAERTVLNVGNTTLELLEFDFPGRPYPQDLSPYDTRFQHFAIVVTDMQRAMERLRPIAGWTAISSDGPQTLPPSAGGVTAFKFRDPDGHPLEFLEFPAGKSPRHWKLATEAGVVSGIDHSALSVRDVDRSMNFYRSWGLHESARTLNHGIEQERLDGVEEPLVDVIALAPSVPTPHVELLHYRIGSRPPPVELAFNDIAAARLIVSLGSDARQDERQLVRDPDGHFLQVLDPAG